METIIVSCFPGCGKTFLYKNNIFSLKILDLDSSEYTEQDNWPQNYFEEIISQSNKFEMILISQHEEILKLLHQNDINFFVVAPNNYEFLSPRKRTLIKQQWFGRFLLRDNSHIINTIGLNKWFHILLVNYDKWTSLEHLTKYKPQKIYLLDNNEYLMDIIPLVYNDFKSEEM